MDSLRQCRSVSAKGNNLIHDFHKCTVLIKALLFKMFCGSLYTAFHIVCIQKTFSCLSWCFKKKKKLSRWASNSTLFVSHNVPSFQEVIRRNAYSFYTRVAVCINILVAYVINNIYSEDSTLQKRCHYLLH